MRRRGSFSCRDGFCGALDCNTCRPGNNYNENEDGDDKESEEESAYWHHIDTLMDEARGN